MKPGPGWLGDRGFNGQEERAAHPPHPPACPQGANRPDGTARGQDAGLTRRFGLQPNQITQWKRQLVEHASGAFGGGAEPAPPADLQPLKLAASLARPGSPPRWPVRRKR